MLKAWDYARTIFQSEKLRIAYIKAEIGTGKHSFCCFEDDCMVVHTLCMLSMYHGYGSWLCIMAMNHGNVSWLCIMAICIMAMSHGYVTWACIIVMYHGYVSWLCIMAMYHGYVSWLCILAMYHGYVSWQCIFSQKVVPQVFWGQSSRRIC